MTASKAATVRKLLASEAPPMDVAGNHGVSIPTVYRGIPDSSRS